MSLLARAPRPRLTALTRLLTAALSPPPRPPGEFLRVGGVVLHVVRDGPADAPAVVMTSGLGGAWLSWDAVVPLLAGRVQVIRFDRPGLGWSAADPAPPTAAGEARRIRALMCALRASGPVVVVGHSLGGIHAEAFARLYPDDTAGLVLAESACEPVTDFASRPRRRLRVARALGSFAGHTGVSQILGPRLRRHGLQTQSLRGVDPADPRHTRGAFCHSATVTGALIERVTCHDMAAELFLLRNSHAMPAIPVKVLAATGPNSAPAAQERWRRHQRGLAALLPGADHQDIEHSAHLMPVDRPDAIAAAILEIIGTRNTALSAGERCEP